MATEQQIKKIEEFLDNMLRHYLTPPFGKSEEYNMAKDDFMNLFAFLRPNKSEKKHANLDQVIFYMIKARENDLPTNGSSFEKYRKLIVASAVKKIDAENDIAVFFDTNANTKSEPQSPRIGM